MTNDSKWPSPRGHAIASSETDKLPKLAALLAEAVKVIEFYADAESHKDYAIIDVMPDRNGEPMEYIADFNNDYNLDKGRLARDFLAKIER